MSARVMVRYVPKLLSGCSLGEGLSVYNQSVLLTESHVADQITELKAVILALKQVKESV